MDRTEEQRINEAVVVLTSAVNSLYGETVAEALSHEHPTLLGQVAKFVGIGVMRRTIRGPWKPFSPKPADILWCNRENVTTILGTDVRLDSIPHPEHDGRLDCSTIIGAELIARQSLI